MAGPSLPDRVGQWYYTYGLFCSSHPKPAIVFSVACVLLCCYPLLNIPLPGSIPNRIIIPNHNDLPLIYNDTQHLKGYQNFSDNIVKLQQHSSEGDVFMKHPKPKSLSELINKTIELPYLWAKDDPLMYIQQIIIKTGVSPWNENLKLADAFRAPIQGVFRLIEIIRNFEHSESGETLSHLCYHVENVKKKYGNSQKSTILPEYNCLILSPANFWQQNLHRFKTDPNVLNTIYNHQNFQTSKVSVADILFGMKLKDTGIKRYPIRSRTRVLHYAITLIFNKFDEKYLLSLQKKLQSEYPLYQDANEGLSELILIHYPGEFNYQEFVPLCVSFIVLFFYVYFSVKKIELVRSKWGLATGAVLTVAGSLSMSVGICFFFGLTLSLQGKEIFPYLIILVGFENVLVLTKSVMSTDSMLDVKIRLAQGLSKEGWSITKTLLTEITILTFSLFTFVPVIQEFSIFMIVSLLSDFFLQMVFFATILGIDVRRMEMSRDKTTDFQLKGFFNSASQISTKNDFLRFQTFSNRSLLEEAGVAPKKMVRSKSHPKLNGFIQSATDVVGGHYQNCKPGSPGKSENKVPKRIRLFNIWARTRFFQRAFMILMVVWISMICYNSGLIKDIFEIKNSSENETMKSEYSLNNDVSTLNSFDMQINNESRILQNYNEQLNWSDKVNQTLLVDITKQNATNAENLSHNQSNYIALKHNQLYQPWKRLSNFHWSTLMSQYNISVAGRFVAVLPPILLSYRISPEMAISARNPEEKGPKPVQWHALVAALDPLDLSEMEIENWHLSSLHQQYWSKISSSNDLPFYPTTPMEILLLTILCAISILVIAYTMVVIYRCVCSRNYAEWRSSWTKDGDSTHNKLPQPSIQFIMEAVPIVVSGHTSEVECIVTDGDFIVSSCLQGQLKVWNSQNGELLANIDRKSFFGFPNNTSSTKEILKLSSASFEHKNENSADISETEFEYEKPRGNSIKERIKTHIASAMENIKAGSQNDPAFSSQLNSKAVVEQTSYDFARQYRQIYMNSDRIKDSMKNNYETCSYDNKNGCCSSNLCQICEIKSDKCNHKDSMLEQTNIMTNQLTSFKFDYGTKENIDPGEISANVDQSDLNSAFNSNNCVRHRNSRDVVNYIPNNSSDSYNEQYPKTRSSPPIYEPFESGPSAPSPIWSIDYAENLIVVGCANGRIEFWEASTGRLKCMVENAGLTAGVTHLRLGVGVAQVFAARLGGQLESLRVDVYNVGRGISVDWSFSAAYKRTHVRTGSADSIPVTGMSSWKFGADFSGLHSSDDQIENEPHDNLRCIRVAVTRAHQQPINALECGGGRVLTGSYDHTLKVFACPDLSHLYTLHGHCGPITSCFIDRMSPVIGGSGSQDGLLCVWDLHTGACLYSVQAHDGAITSLAYSASYVMSAGIDERLCIFDRFQGHLLNTLFIGMSYTCNILPLTHSLLLVGGKNSFTVWDVSYGQIVRKVVLGQNDGFVSVKQIAPLKDAIVCDYANQLRIVRFPLISKMFESVIKTD